MQKDSLQIVSETLEFIERNLTEEIGVPDICAQIPLSAVQAQRLFRGLVGDSMGSYLRIRRLSEAAEAIRSNPKMRILDVAVLYQFGSQEAFARAFKAHFGVKPTEITSHSSLLNLKKKPSLNAEKLRSLQKLSATLITMPERHFIGLKSQIISPLDPDCDCFGVVPRLWEDFYQRRREIKPRKSSVNYGIGVTSTGSMLDTSLSYLAGHEVDPSVEVPADMHLLRLPPTAYAEFRLQGSGREIHTAIDYIYGIWLPGSGHERAEGFDVEVIDPDFRLEDATSKMTYSLPIR